MATIRLYRRFYKAESDGTNNLYNLIEPFFISATSYIKDSSVVIQTNLIITQESLGVYYTDLDPNLYSFSNTYDLKWSVQYLENKPTKTLITSFRLNPISVSSEITTDIEDQEIEILIL